MGLYVGSTVINTPDIDEAVAFWTAALGYVVRSADPTFAVLTDPGRRWSNISLQHSEEPKRGLNRVHLDLYTADRDREVSRLEGLGRLRWCRGSTRRTTIMSSWPLQTATNSAWSRGLSDRNSTPTLPVDVGRSIRQSLGTLLATIS
ncbi:MAG: VOC family protein [Candidatus Dormiibacterota bacterium]